MRNDKKDLTKIMNLSHIFFLKYLQKKIQINCKLISYRLSFDSFPLRNSNATSKSDSGNPDGMDCDGYMDSLNINKRNEL